MLTSTESTSLLKPEHASSYASLTDATSLIQSESGSSSSYSSYSSLTDALPDAVELGEAPQHLEGTRKDAGPRDCHLGLLCVTTSSFLFGLVAALVKLVALEPYVMLQVRGSLQWLLSLVAVGACVKTSTTTAARFFGEPRQRPILLLRSGLYWTYVSLWWHALAGMPVGDATAMVYCAPLLTALFGWLLLGERVPPKVFGCLALSLVGVGLITRPTFLFGHGTNGAEYSRGALCACGSAVVGGLLPVLVRKSRECHWATVEHVAALGSSAVFTPAALALHALGHRDVDPGESPEAWEGLPDLRQLLLLGLVALVGFAALGLQTFGYQRERAARASAMNFLEIPFSYVLQFLLFGDLLRPAQGLGMLLVVASGLLNLYSGVPRLVPPNSPCPPLSGAQLRMEGERFSD